MILENGWIQIKMDYCMKHMSSNGDRSLWMRSYKGVQIGYVKSGLF